MWSPFSTIAVGFPTPVSEFRAIPIKIRSFFGSESK